MSGAPVLGFDESSSERERLVAAAPIACSSTRCPTPHRHEIDRRLDLLRQAGGEVEDSAPEVWLDDPTRERLGTRWPAQGSSATMWSSRRQAATASEALAAGRVRRGHQSGAHRWPGPILVGGPSDLGLVDDVPDHVRRSSTIPIGRLVPMATAAVIERSASFVGAEFGMSHVAAALGVPTVSVFRPTCTHASRLTAPRSTSSRSGCRIGRAPGNSTSPAPRRASSPHRCAWTGSPRSRSGTLWSP